LHPSLGLHAIALVDSHIQSVSAAMAGPDVAVVTVSHSGSTVETVLATRLAKEARARTAALPGSASRRSNAIATSCCIPLPTRRYRPEAMSIHVAQLAIVDTLVSCCALADPQKSVERLQRSARVIVEKRF
jgi:DNA-binding MurR/RpiR family transcriptional regulator